MLKLSLSTTLLGLLSFQTAIAAPSTEKPYFYKGHDLSSLHILELGNTSYRDTARHNETRPAEDILGDGGMNGVRLRIWVNPTGEYTNQYDLAYTLSQAQRFSKKGYRIYLDFHFSDIWADPNHQYPPAAWPTTVAGLESTIRQYVSSTLVAFKQGGVNLDIVSLGNEIRNGMLWPIAEVDPWLEPVSARVANFTQFAEIWASARQGVTDAVKAGVKKPQVMIHIDDGYNKTLQENWFGALTATGEVTTADWDIFGFSFYPFYGTNATFANLKDTLGFITSKYNKPIHVAETDWPDSCSGSNAPVLSDTSIPVSVAGQVEWVNDIVQVVQSVPKGLAGGVWYWEPTWLNNTGLGSACEDAILFSGDYSEYPTHIYGYSRSSVDMFQAGRGYV